MSESLKFSNLNSSALSLFRSAAGYTCVRICAHIYIICTYAWHSAAATAAAAADSSGSGDSSGGDYGAYELVRNAFSVYEYSRISAFVKPRPLSLGCFLLLLFLLLPLASPSHGSHIFLFFYLSVCFAGATKTCPRSPRGRTCSFYRSVEN